MEDYNLSAEQVELFSHADKLRAYKSELVRADEIRKRCRKVAIWLAIVIVLTGLTVAALFDNLPVSAIFLYSVPGYLLGINLYFLLDRAMKGIVGLYWRLKKAPLVTKEISIYSWSAESAFKKYAAACEQYEKDVLRYEQYKTLIRRFSSEEAAACFEQVTQRLSAFECNPVRDNFYWKNMDHRQFEFEVARVYEQLGYAVRVTPQSGDGGVDVVLKKDGVTTYVQCKHYCYDPLGAPAMREFFGVCAADGVNGIMVCLSHLTADAMSYYRKASVRERIQYVSREQLIDLDRQGTVFQEKNCFRTFVPTFRTFLANYKFRDCGYAWVREQLFYKETEALAYIKNLPSWAGMKYVLLRPQFSSGNQLIQGYVVVLVHDFAYPGIQKLSMQFSTKIENFRKKYICA